MRKKYITITVTELRRRIKPKIYKANIEQFNRIFLDFNSIKCNILKTDLIKER